VRRRCLLALLAALIAGPVQGQEWVIRHAKTGDPPGRNVYQVEVLTALLQRTVDSHGPFRLVPMAEMPQAREIRSLIDHHYHDVLWTMTSAEREAEMRPVRFPLLRGLLGHRVCLVRSDDPLLQQPEPPQRDQLVIGQAVTWPDTPIFIDNGFVTETGSDYQSTRRMLLAGRTNCFPRGLNEVDIELAAYGQGDLAVEPSLSFLYFAPMYFFVARDREDLAERLQVGLQRIGRSGELDAIYARYFEPARLLQRYRMAERRIHCLDNPLLSPEMLAAMRAHMISGPGSFADSCLAPATLAEER